MSSGAGFGVVAGSSTDSKNRGAEWFLILRKNNDLGRESPSSDGRSVELGERFKGSSCNFCSDRNPFDSSDSDEGLGDVGLRGLRGHPPGTAEPVLLGESRAPLGVFEFRIFIKERLEAACLRAAASSELLRQTSAINSFTGVEHSSLRRTTLQETSTIGTRIKFVKMQTKVVDQWKSFKKLNINSKAR